MESNISYNESEDFCNNSETHINIINMLGKENKDIILQSDSMINNTFDELEDFNTFQNLNDSLISNRHDLSQYDRLIEDLGTNNIYRHLIDLIKNNYENSNETFTTIKYINLLHYFFEDYSSKINLSFFYNYIKNILSLEFNSMYNYLKSTLIILDSINFFNFYNDKKSINIVGNSCFDINSNIILNLRNHQNCKIKNYNSKNYTYFSNNQFLMSYKTQNLKLNSFFDYDDKYNSIYYYTSYKDKRRIPYKKLLNKSTIYNRKAKYFVFNYVPILCGNNNHFKSDKNKLFNEIDNCIFSHNFYEILFHPLYYKVYSCKYKKDCKISINYGISYCPYVHDYELINNNNLSDVCNSFNNLNLNLEDTNLKYYNDAFFSITKSIYNKNLEYKENCVSKTNTTDRLNKIEGFLNIIMRTHNSNNINNLFILHTQLDKNSFIFEKVSDRVSIFENIDIYNPDNLIFFNLVFEITKENILTNFINPNEILYHFTQVRLIENKITNIHLYNENLDQEFNIYNYKTIKCPLKSLCKYITNNKCLNYHSNSDKRRSLINNIYDEFATKNNFEFNYHISLYKKTLCSIDSCYIDEKNNKLIKSNEFCPFYHKNIYSIKNNKEELPSIILNKDTNNESNMIYSFYSLKLKEIIFKHLNRIENNEFTSSLNKLFMLQCSICNIKAKFMKTLCRGLSCNHIICLNCMNYSNKTEINLIKFYNIINKTVYSINDDTKCVNYIIDKAPFYCKICDTKDYFLIFNNN